MMKLKDELEYMFHAAKTGDLSALKKCTANIDSWETKFHSKSGDTVLILAARCGHFPLLTFLIGACQDDNLKQTNFTGKNALHEAAQAGHLECVRYLLRCGIQVDSLKQADWTPLMLACTKENIDIVKELINNGANPLLRNKDGWNSFHIACREGHLPIVSYLHDANNQAWDTVSKNGRTPLHTTALHGHAEVTAYLLKNVPYDVNVRDSCGTTPLLEALRAGYVNVAEMLLQNGADLRVEDNLGRHAIHLAAQAGSVVSMEFLCQVQNVDLNLPTSVSGATAIHVASKENQHSIIKYLLNRGANIEATDNKSRTALHIACGSQHLESVRVLLESGAKGRLDNSGKTAHDLLINKSIKDLFLSK